MSIKKITIFWRDIPSQVLIQKGRNRIKKMLGHRFQEAIDRAAMRAGKGSSDAYINEWRRVTEIIDKCPDIEALLIREVIQLEDKYSDSELLSLIRNHGAAQE